MANRRIWKYPITLDDRLMLDMPRGAQLLHVDMQADWITVWAMVDADAPHTARTVFVVGTGHPIPDAATAYVGSVMDGAYVWHLFDGGES